jgi:cerevisin
MEALTALLCATLAFSTAVLGAPLKPHESGGLEHIVLISKDQPIPPRVEEVLERLELHDKHPDVRRIFNNSAFVGFSASMQSHCLDKLAKMTDISLVEQATNIPGAQASSNPFDTRPNAPWGLQRISTASSVNGNSEALDYTYSFANSNLGEGSDIYMIDTGIYTANNIFNGRAKMIWSFDGIMTDNDGHGTHTAGTAGGNVLGVASKANVWGIKALDKQGGGWSSDVIGAIDHVIKFHDAKKKSAGNKFQGSVLSMSLAASGNVQSMNLAIQHAVRAGVHSVVAAGNDGTNACLASPASAGGSHGPAITVGAIQIDGSRASFSNYGACVDVYAPGVSVISSWIGGPNMINSLSGTSMATPHVTGIVAYAMANSTLAGDPALMKEFVRVTALAGQNGMLVANNGVQNAGR